MRKKKLSNYNVYGYNRNRLNNQYRTCQSSHYNMQKKIISDDNVTKKNNNRRSATLSQRLKLMKRKADDAPTKYFGEETSYGSSINTGYPSVLTQAIKTALDPSLKVTNGNILASVAQQMKISPLDLAKQITNQPDITNAYMPNVSNMDLIQKYLPVPGNLKDNDIVKTKSSSVNERQPKQTEIDKKINPAHAPAPASCDGSDYGSSVPTQTNEKIATTLDKVLCKLEHLNGSSSDKAIEGAPCNIIGSWNSYTIGIRLDISLGKPKERTLSAAEKSNKLLSIEAQECCPPKHSSVITPDWHFMGSAVKQLGGPFYIYSQKHGENVIALFAGFCRTCGGIDTIFGSWTFLYPSKDCQDISTSIESKRDIFRRNRMDAKRKEALQKKHKPDDCDDGSKD